MNGLAGRGPERLRTGDACLSRNVPVGRGRGCVEPGRVTISGSQAGRGGRGGAGGPEKEQSVKELFQISGGRWSAVVNQIEPEAFGHPDPLLVVEICCGDVQAVRFVFCPSHNRAAFAPAGGDTTPLARGDVSRFDPSDVDLEDLLFLVCATDSLCQNLHEGASVERWCAAQGLRPLREKKVRRRPDRPSPLLIRTEKWQYLLSVQKAAGEQEPLRGGLYR